MWSSPRAATTALVVALAGSQLVAPAAAVLVYVTSYAGTLTTLNLTLSPGSNSSGTITQVAVNNDCGPNASWLTLEKRSNALYCLNEDFDSPNGTLVAYRTDDNGTLTTLKKVQTPAGPVSAVIFGTDRKGLAVAAYTGGALSTYESDPASLAEIQSEFFALSQPGPDASRQAAPHPHEVIVDPKGGYLVVPDLGADEIRVFGVNQTSLGWSARPALEAAAGSGPRHATFVTAENSSTSYMYYTTELTNKVVGCKVGYAPAAGVGQDPGLDCEQVFASGTYGPNQTVPASAAAAEIVTSPDNRFVIVSTRNDGAFNISSFDPNNSTQIPSDSISTFQVDLDTGELSLVQIFPAGGLVPRQFTINKAGTLLGVGLQGSSRVVFINREVVSGRLLGYAGAFDIAGEVTSVVFDE